MFPELWYDIWLIAIYYLRLFIKFYGKYESTKNDQNQHFFGFSDRDKNFLENFIDRHKKLKPTNLDMR